MAKQLLMICLVLLSVLCLSSCVFHVLENGLVNESTDRKVSCTCSQPTVGQNGSEMENPNRPVDADIELGLPSLVGP